jgi:hypothetical protein
MCGDDADCAAGAQYLGGQSDYYDAEEGDGAYDNADGANDNGEDASETSDNGDRSYMDEGWDSVNYESSTASNNYMPYFILGAVLTGFIMALVWRKRVSRFLK